MLEQVCTFVPKEYYGLVDVLREAKVWEVEACLAGGELTVVHKPFPCAFPTAVERELRKMVSALLAEVKVEDCDWAIVLVDVRQEPPQAQLHWFCRKHTSNTVSPGGT